MQPSPQAHVRSVDRRIVGRYAVYGKIAAGGMAVVHLGRILGDRGFARTVAVKRLHEQFATDPKFAERFVQEARIVSRIRHPNVVPTLDVVSQDDELLLVMEYVHGEALSRLVRRAAERSAPIPTDVASAILAGILHGLHAAHTASAPTGELLGVVHRDVSPQNVLVGVDGVARLLDFGIAKVIDTTQSREGTLTGKLAYMAPEQISQEPLSARTDVYAASVVLWEALTGRRLFAAENEAALIQQVLIGYVEPPSRFAPDVTEELDALVLRGLAKAPGDRFASAREMALALESCVPPAPPSKVAEWVEGLAGEMLASREREIARNESDTFAPGESESEVSVISAPEVAPARSRRNLGYAAVAGVLCAAIAVGATVATREGRVGAAPRAPEASSTPVVAPPALPASPPDVSSADAGDAPFAAATHAPSPKAPARRPTTKPGDAKRQCESVDPATGDIRFNPACK
jgi:serine/threonine protein kinase